MNFENDDSTWTLEKIVTRLHKIRDAGFISVPEDEFRRDEGIIGQLLEKQFGLIENNFPLRDLGTFELKGMRKKASTLTLCHKTTADGLTPIQLFDRFGYIKPSKRDPSIIKKKLFSTIKGTAPNNLNLVLGPDENTKFSIYYQPNDEKREFLAKWDVEDKIEKIDKIILVYANAEGRTNARDERFHFIEAWLLKGIKSVADLIDSGVIVVDLCIDKPVDSTKAPHDRGPHIRIPKSKLSLAYKHVEQIM